MASFSDLKSGDLLVWSKSSRKGVGNFNYLKLVRFLTISEFGHVSVIWKQKDRIDHVEAVTPSIQKVKVPLVEGLYVIPMNLDVSDKDMGAFFNDKLGLPYGVADAFRGWLGLTAKNDLKWQCAELSLEFYRSLGMDIPDAFTPSELIQTLMHNYQKPLLKLTS